MTDLGFLRQPLNVADSPGMDGDDPRFAHICDLAEHARFNEAAAEVQRLLDQNVYDIRTLVYYFYQTFEERGARALGEILECMHLLLESNWNAFGPAVRRERYVDRSLSWLFEKLCDALEYHEQKATTTWVRIMDGLEPEDVTSAMDQAQQLGKWIEGPEYKNAGNQLSRLAHWLRDRHELLVAQEEQAEHMTDQAGFERSPSVAPSKPPLSVPPPDGAGTLQLEVSHKFLMLRRKLAAFERLVAKGDFVKAALVSNDIQDTLESFDPRDYFPRMFASYGALVNEHVSSLAPHWQDTESTSWKAMEQFYRVDLDRFIGE
ncbi:MAG: type VI secretion system protein IglI family protein [Myxococcales bacterium]|nr:type VI secretion system protein IglI family protein [Myxococcales bacterium]MDD9966910.1 type VI secretion system protein IglI family protein [Myxococcales bacterium]